MSREYLYNTSVHTIEISHKIQYIQGEADGYANLGIYFLGSNNYIKALEYFYLSIKKFNSVNILSKQSIIYIRIGDIYTTLQRFDNATFSLNKGYQIAFQYKDTTNIEEALILLGQNAAEQGQYKNAINFYNKSLTYLRISPKPELLSKTYKAVGDLYLSKLDYDSATQYYFKAIDANKNIKFTYSSNSGAVYTLLAHIAQQREDFEDALHYNRLALSWRKSNKLETHYISSLINVGNSFLDLKNYDSALYYLKTGLDLASKTQIYHLCEYGNKKLYDYYSKQNDQNAALRYFILYSTAKDSVVAEKNRNNITLFETNRILSETEEKNAILSKENDIQRLKLKIKNFQNIVLFITLILTSVICIIFYRLFFKNKKSKLKLIRINNKLDQEIEYRKVFENQLQESESLHKFLTDNSKDVITRIDCSKGLRYISPSCMDLYGFNQVEMHNKLKLSEEINPDYYPELNHKSDQLTQIKAPAKFTFRTKRKDGTYFWVESHVNPIFDSMTNQLMELISVHRDVSDRMDQEDSLMENAGQKELLIREIHHRTKNNFATLISLMNLQAEQTPNDELIAILTDLRFRVRTMSILHEQLYRSKNILNLSLEGYLCNLSNVIVQAYNIKGIHVHVSIEDCYFEIESALPLGLIINELLTNSFKYAFPDGKNGNIWVEFRTLKSKEKLAYRKEFVWILRVKDDGVGLPATFDIKNFSSLGLQIISILNKNLHGELIVEGTHGASFTILIPKQGL